MLQQRADGPYRGSASKDLEIVEFADFQCPHCKEAQANMDKLAVDFPKARIVFRELSAAAASRRQPRAAAYGVCVAKQGGSDAFFTFASAVFDGQDGLATADGATLTLNSAVTKAGLDPAKIAACARLPRPLAQVEASVKLAQDLGINQTPTLVVNGRQVPATLPTTPSSRSSLTRPSWTAWPSSGRLRAEPHATVKIARLRPARRNSDQRIAPAMGCSFAAH